MSPPAVNGAELNAIAAPVLGAVIALVGVLIGLVVTGTRARRESRLSREDQLRNDQRRVIAELLASGRSYRRLGEMLSDQLSWVEFGYERATVLADSTEQAMAEFQQHLDTARLFIDERPLTDDLDTVMEVNQAVAGVIHEAVNSFWENRMPGPVVSRRVELWQEFADVMNKLRDDAITELRPTIRTNQRFW